MRESGNYCLNINDSPRSIYYNSNMIPRFFGHISIFSLVFFVNFFGNLRNNAVVKNLQVYPLSPKVVLEFWYIERGLLDGQKKYPIVS